jgi:hypothetical protein
MNAHTILTKIISLVSFKMHLTRQKALIACVRSLVDGSAASVTSIGRGIGSKAFEKHRIKRTDRLLSNANLQREGPLIYTLICRLFCTSKHPVIAIDWSDLDEHKGHFLLRAAMTVKGRPVTLYQEVHSNKTKEKPATHKAFLGNLHAMLPADCQPIIVTDAGYKSPWFREVQALNWKFVGRVRKPHFYSLDKGNTWQCISQLYQQASCRPKRFDNAQIARSKPFACTLILMKQKNKGRHATNPDGSRKHSGLSLKHAQSANDPWLLATSLPAHRNLSKQVIAIYRQRMQIEEGFRDMKSTRFGLGFERSNSIKPARLAILILLATLASLVAILLGMALTIANKHRRFQANTESKHALSFHTLGIRALAARIRFTHSQWKRTIQWLNAIVDEAWHGRAWN